MNQNNDDVRIISSFLKANDDYVIVCHENPDGDALGSMFALAIALKRMNKRVQTVCVDEVPHKYMCLAGTEALKKPDELGAFMHLICVDCADIQRAGLRNEVISAAKTVLNIDHHASNNGYGQYQLLSTDTAAAGILVYELLKAMGVSIDSLIAQNLLIAISSDTGHFSHANTDVKSLNVAAELVSHGANANTVAHKIFQVKTCGWVKLLGKAIESLELYCHGKAALMCLSLQDFSDSEATFADVEGIIDMARNIETVEVAALIRETDEHGVRVSLRSKDEVDVSRIATVFAGGGHMRAAGFSVDATLGEAKKLLVSVLLEELKCSE